MNRWIGGWMDGPGNGQMKDQTGEWVDGGLDGLVVIGLYSNSLLLIPCDRWLLFCFMLLGQWFCFGFAVCFFLKFAGTYVFPHDLLPCSTGYMMFLMKNFFLMKETNMNFQPIESGRPWSSKSPVLVRDPSGSGVIISSLKPSGQLKPSFTKPAIMAETCLTLKAKMSPAFSRSHFSYGPHDPWILGASLSNASHLRQVELQGRPACSETFDRNLVIPCLPEQCSSKFLDSVILPAMHVRVWP